MSRRTTLDEMTTAVASSVPHMDRPAREQWQAETRMALGLAPGGR